MAVILNASTSSGFIQTADTSGQLVIQSNGTTELTVLSTGVTVADNLLFNSGYGSAVVGYGCRAWVNFDGTTNTAGFCTIRGSGGVTSVADNGTGNYTVNFSFTMPDTNYAITGVTSGSDAIISWILTNGTRTTTSVVVGVRNGTNTAQDGNPVSVAIFR